MNEKRILSKKKEKTYRLYRKRTAKENQEKEKKGVVGYINLMSINVLQNPM